VTHAYVGLAALDLVLAALGFALLVGLGFVRTAGEAPRWLGLAFLAGWATIGVVLTLGAIAGVDPNLAQVLLAAAILSVAFVAARRFFPAVPAVAAPRSRSPLACAASLAGLGLVLMTALAAIAEAFLVNADMSWDSVQFWVPKAKAIYYFHGLDTGLGGYTTYTNNEYPPLAPVMNAVTFHFMGGAEAVLLPLQTCLLFVAFAASIAVLLRRVPGWILWPSLALLVLAPQMWARLYVVMPDQILAYLLATAAVAGLLWIEDALWAWLVLAGVFLAAAALTKTEGVLLGFSLAAVIVGGGLVRRRRGALAGLLLLLAPLAILPWKLWLDTHHQPVSATAYHWGDLLHPVYLAGRLHRLTYAVGRMGDFLADPTYWSPILPLVVATLILFAPALRELSAALAIWILLAFFGLASVYWTSELDLHWYVATSASRVVSNLPIVAGAVLPLLLAVALERDRRARSRARPEAAPDAGPTATLERASEPVA
jgi:hypothetical protein